MQLFYAPEIKNTLQLPADEAKHCIKILRHKTGDMIMVTDGKGCFYDCEIIAENHCQVKILKEDIQTTSHKHSLHLAIAPTKNSERTDWMIEKVIEFGIDEITFLNCDHNERNKLNLERCERIAVSAMKQSLKATLPKINDLVSFKKFVVQEETSQATKLIAHCDASKIRTELGSFKTAENIIYCIGPEGDFSNQEIELATLNGFTGISLGNSRLRTETAAIGVCSYFYFNDLR